MNYIVETTRREMAEDTTRAHEYVRTFRMRTDSLLTAKEVLAVSQLPQLMDPYRAERNGLGLGGDIIEDQTSHVVNRRATNLENDTHAWDIVIEYSRDGSPVYEPWEVDWGFVEMKKALVIDPITGDAILNAAGDPFDPPPDNDDPRLELTISRWLLFWSPLTAKDYRNSTNSDELDIDGIVFQPRDLKLQVYGARREMRSGRYYWKNKIVLHVDDDGWKLKLLNRGYRYKDPVDGKVKPILDHWGGQTTTPHLLKANGDKVVPGVDSPSYSEYNRFKELPYAGLDLDYATH